MISRKQMLDYLKNGREVTIELTNAQVVSVRSELRPISHYRCATLTKVIVRDEVLGSIYFGGFSDKLRYINYGDKVSLKVKVTGVGDATEKYPDPILFAKPLTRKGDSVKVDARPANTEENDLSINV